MKLRSCFGLIIICNKIAFWNIEAHYYSSDLLSCYYSYNFRNVFNFQTSDYWNLFTDDLKPCFFGF